MFSPPPSIVHTQTHVWLSSGWLSSVLFVLRTYSQSQFPHQPSAQLLRVQADTSSCRLPYFWNLSNLSWESLPPSHHPGAYGPLSIYPPLSSPPPIPPTFISHPNLPLAKFSAPSNFCLLFLLSFVFTHLRSMTNVPPPLCLGLSSPVWTERNQVCHRMKIIPASRWVPAHGEGTHQTKTPPLNTEGLYHKERPCYSCTFQRHCNPSLWSKWL